MTRPPRWCWTTQSTPSGGIANRPTGTWLAGGRMVEIWIQSVSPGAAPGRLRQVARRRFSWVVVAILLMAGLGGGSVAAADDAHPPALTVQAVSIIWPDGETVSTPAVQIPGGGQSAVSDWGSSADQPVVGVGTASSTASVTRKAMTGDVQLDGLSLFGGEVTLASMSFATSHSTRVERQRPRRRAAAHRRCACRACPRPAQLRWRSGCGGS